MKVARGGLALVLLSGMSAVAIAQQPALLPEWVRACSIPPDRAVGVERRSVYVPAADGVELAVDVYLPENLSATTKLPTLFMATRYWRSQRDAPVGPTERRWVARGYAVVVADVRGTGASFGQWPFPWAPKEVEDLGHLVRWIARQAWSNGRVGTTGNSYPGNTAQLAAAFGGAAIKAVVPRFMDFDMYTDLLFPGGVIGESLTVLWGRMVRDLDENVPRLTATGGSIRPVDTDRDGSRLAAAIASHRENPLPFDQAAFQVTYRDDRFGGLPVDLAGAFRYQREIERSGVPIFGWASWLDAGTAQGALNRFLSWSNPQLLVIGPWTHGARGDANPFAPPDRPVDPPPAILEDQYFCFLDRYLGRSAPVAADRAIVYYTMGEERWKRTTVWPVAGTKVERFSFDQGKKLVRGPATGSGRDEYRVDFDATTGPHGRWSTQAASGDIVFPDRAGADRRLLTYDSDPLPRDLEVTGHPVVTLRVTSTHSDGNFFVYLEDVAPDGQVRYVTDGQLRARHRRLGTGTPPYRTLYPYRTFERKDAEPLVPGQPATLTFQLFPTSALFRAGHRIRVAIAGADRDWFQRLPAATEGPVTITITRGSGGSFIELPVVARGQ